MSENRRQPLSNIVIDEVEARDLDPFTGDSALSTAPTIQNMVTPQYIENTNYQSSSIISPPRTPTNNENIYERTLPTWAPLRNYAQYVMEPEFRTPSPRLPMRYSNSTPDRMVLATPRSLFGTDLEHEYRKLTDPGPVFTKSVCLLCLETANDVIINNKTDGCVCRGYCSG
uniref:Uncharacterized protein n=1 Tax=Meloidogyne incognita TaxID=6306 RepID=A0A914MNT8_MELIC